MNVSTSIGGNRVKAIQFVTFLLPMASLNSGQRNIYDVVVTQRKSIFYGGEAGTGKTHVADVMIEALTNAGVNVCVCASTGQAAQHLENGFTVHMLFGLRPANDPNTPAIRKGGWPMKQALEQATVIFVDEISMLDEQLFSDMHERLVRMRGNNRPFGGVQMVALGDFLQLPPVKGKYCFHSALFQDTFGDRCFRLTEQMRQGEDLAFARILGQIRVGECTYGVESCLRTRLFDVSRAPPASEVTYLYCRRDQVEAKNNACLDALPSERHTWPAKDWTLSDEFAKPLQTCVLETSLVLKAGAPVLLRNNFDTRRKLTNGTRGVVVGMATMCELGERTSCTLARCSHVPMLTNPELLGDLRPHLDELPVVEFHGIQYAIGCTTIEKRRGNQTKGHKRKAGDPGDAPPPAGHPGELLATRQQIPLTLAFALTVHKSQGMTLEKICFVWDNAFDNGQIYVALSRVRKLNHVYIISTYVPKRRITAAQDALEFEQKRVQALQ